MRESFSIIVATKNRAPMIQALLDSMREVAGLERIRPQIIVGDNNSEDGTWELLQRTAANFPLPIKLLKVKRPGKSAVLNDAVRAAVLSSAERLVVGKTMPRAEREIFAEDIPLVGAHLPGRNGDRGDVLTDIKQDSFQFHDIPWR